MINEIFSYKPAELPESLQIKTFIGQDFLQLNLEGESWMNVTTQRLNQDYN